MNPLTLVKRIQKINAQEASLGISEQASWHAKYKESAYVFVGGIPYDLTEGDLLAVFAQYGEIVDVNLVRDKGTGKSKGFAFVAYEDQRSTNLAVDNLNGAQILGRIIRVDHVTNYKKKEEEDEETEQKKREARGVCRAFQRGECSRGAGCKFSHDEQRAANTGWGAKDASSKWGHDNFEDPKDRVREMRGKGRKNIDDLETHSRENGRRLGNKLKDHDDDRKSQLKSREDDDRKEKRMRRNDDESELKLRGENCQRDEKGSRRNHDELPQHSRRDYNRREEDRARRHDDEDYRLKSREEDKSRSRDDEDYQRKLREDDSRREEDRSRRHDDEEYRQKSREDDGKSERGRSTRNPSESYKRENQDERRDSRSAHGRDFSSHSHREGNDDRRRSDR